MQWKQWNCHTCCSFYSFPRIWRQWLCMYLTSLVNTYYVYICFGLRVCCISSRSVSSQNNLGSARNSSLPLLFFRDSVELLSNAGVHTKIWAAPVIPGRQRKFVIPLYLDEGRCDQFLQRSLVDGFRIYQRSRVRAWRDSTSSMTPMRYRACKTSLYVFSTLWIDVDNADNVLTVGTMCETFSCIHELVKRQTKNTNKLKTTKTILFYLF